MVADFLSNDCSTSTEDDRPCCSRLYCRLCDLSQPLVRPSFVIYHYPSLFVNIVKMQAEELRAGKAIRIFVLQSWFCTVGTELMEEGTANC